MPDDWHKEDIKAAVRKRGMTLFALSIHAGFCGSAARAALRRPFPAVERVIATFLGFRPEVIWPSRYDASGVPLRGFYSKKPTANRRRRHRQK